MNRSGISRLETRSTRANKEELVKRVMLTVERVRKWEKKWVDSTAEGCTLKIFKWVPVSDEDIKKVKKMQDNTSDSKNVVEKLSPPDVEKGIEKSTDNHGKELDALSESCATQNIHSDGVTTSGTSKDCIAHNTDDNVENQVQQCVESSNESTIGLESSKNIAEQDSGSFHLASSNDESNYEPQSKITKTDC